jgi:hypothetical protein
MAAKRTVIATSARALGAALTLAAGAALVVGAVIIPLPSHTADVTALTVSPTPLPQSLTCAGSLFQLSNGTGSDATSASGVGKPSRVEGTSDDDADTETKALGAPDNTTVTDDTAPQLVTSPKADPGVLVAAAQTVSVYQQACERVAAC